MNVNFKTIQHSFIVIVYIVITKYMYTEHTK